MSSVRSKLNKKDKDHLVAYSKDTNRGLIKSLAFNSLTGAAKSVCIMCFIENSCAAHHNTQKTEQGRPYFKWSALDSAELGISGRNHFKVIELLTARGFIKLHKSGGLKGANGTANYFVLSSDWKRSQPPVRQASPKLRTALAESRNKALLKRNEKHVVVPIVTRVVEQKPVKKSSLVRRKIPLNISSLVESRSDIPLQTGQAVYYKRPEDRRALKAELVKQKEDSWEVRGARTSNNIKRPILTIPIQYLLPVDQVKNAK